MLGRLAMELREWKSGGSRICFGVRWLDTALDGRKALEREPSDPKRCPATGPESIAPTNTAKMGMHPRKSRLMGFVRDSDHSRFGALSALRASFSLSIA